MAQNRCQQWAKNGPKMESNIFSHSMWTNICWNDIGPVLDKNGRVLDLQFSRLGASWSPPEAFPERFGGYFLVVSVMMIIYIIKSVFLKNRRFMLVKRTILKVHLLSLCILGPIFSTCSSFEHQYTSRSIQLHLGNAVCHMSDPLPDPFFAIMIGPKTDLKQNSPEEDGRTKFQEPFPGGWQWIAERYTKPELSGGYFFLFVFFDFFFFSF